jgi:cyanate lyase
MIQNWSEQPRRRSGNQARKRYHHEAHEEHEGREYFLDSMPLYYRIFVSFVPFVLRGHPTSLLNNTQEGGNDMLDQVKLMSRQEATDYLLAAKKAKGLSFEEISKAVGRDKVWVTAAIMGQATMSKDEAEKTVKTLGVGEGLAGQIVDSLQEMPMKGSLDDSVPVDPLLYRFHEITQVYGTTMKALIHEMFGDGIMSAIDFEIDIQKKPDPKGDRVIVTYNGKFLPYRKW